MWRHPPAEQQQRALQRIPATAYCFLNLVNKTLDEMDVSLAMCLSELQLRWALAGSQKMFCAGLLKRNFNYLIKN